MFQLACDPSGVVVETTIKELLPAIINWGNKLDHILRVLLSHILGCAQVTFRPLVSHAGTDISSLQYFSLLILFPQ